MKCQKAMLLILKEEESKVIQNSRITFDQMTFAQCNCKLYRRKDEPGGILAVRWSSAGCRQPELRRRESRTVRQRWGLSKPRDRSITRTWSAWTFAGSRRDLKAFAHVVMRTSIALWPMTQTSWIRIIILDFRLPLDVRLRQNLKKSSWKMPSYVSIFH